MCIGLPQRIVSTDGWFAVCEVEGRRSEVHMGLVGPQLPGTWVLTFLGGARMVLDEETAMDLLNARRALEHIRDGGTAVDAWFADLIGREPQLPEGLRTADSAPAPSSPA